MRVLRHPGRPRPWLVAVHGQGMGRPSDDRMLRVLRLHEELGINVALPVLPLHGPRAAGFAPDQQFVSNVYPVNNVLGLTQSVWDIRRLLLWLRADQGATAVGVLGLSLGSYACSLLSTVEGDLACVVAVVPTSDLAGSLRSRPPAPVQAPGCTARCTTTVDPRPPRRLAAGAARASSPTIGGSSSPDRPIASPLPRVPRSCGGTGSEPSILWRPRGHVDHASVRRVRRPPHLHPHDVRAPRPR